MSENPEKRGLNMTIREAEKAIDYVKYRLKEGAPQSLRDKYREIVETLEDLIAEARKILTAANWDTHKYESVTRRIKEYLREHNPFAIQKEIDNSPPEGRWPGGTDYQGITMKYGRNKNINDGVNSDVNSIFHGIGRRRKTRKSRRRKTRRH
jgi:sugar-specific transcriptional regulator TrmB